MGGGQRLNAGDGGGEVIFILHLVVWLGVSTWSGKEFHEACREAGKRMKTKKKMNPKGKGQGPPEWKEASGSSGWNLGTITSDLPSLISKMGQYGTSGCSKDGIRTLGRRQHSDRLKT